MRPRSLAHLHLEETLQREEGVASQPGEEAPHVAPKAHERRLGESAVLGDVAGLGKAGSRLRPQVGVGGGLLQRLAHAHEDARVDVSGALAKVGGHAPLYLRDVEQAPLVVDLLHKPDVSRDGDLLAWWGRGAEGAQLLRVAADGVLHALLEDGIELVIVCDPLAGEAHDEAAGLRASPRSHAPGGDAAAHESRPALMRWKRREREHARGQLWGRELALRRPEWPGSGGRAGCRAGGPGVRGSTQCSSR